MEALSSDERTLATLDDMRLARLIRGSANL
jgi:hypothetical protein